MNNVVQRRAKLGQRISGAALFAAGRSIGRNYPGNPYPFRASSHFLYFVGKGLEGAYALVEQERTRVFIPTPDADDALWHGPQPSAEELAGALGCEVAPLETLPAVLQQTQQVATIPAPDASTREEQAAFLGRGFGRAGGDADLEHAVVALRSVHDDAAQAGLITAAKATAAAHRAGMAATRPGVSEAAVCAAMEFELAKLDCGTAYGSIVTVHGEVLHNHSHGNECREGDLLLADVGAETADGWAGDVTRTWPVSGTFSPTQRAMYDIVLAAQVDAIARVRPGVRYREVHLQAARTLTQGLVDEGILRGNVDSLVERGVHALFFPHGVGHLLGLDVHDMEDLGDRAGYPEGRARDAQFGLSYLRLDRELAEGMAVTVEPGFYQVPAILNDAARCAFAEDSLDRVALERFADVRGIRIEDDVLVSASTPFVMTADAPKSAEDVEATIRAH
ncbi:MAG: aminopeptidase P family protein [Polyangiales bacterium]